MGGAANLRLPAGHSKRRPRSCCQPDVAALFRIQDPRDTLESVGVLGRYDTTVRVLQAKRGQVTLPSPAVVVVVACVACISITSRKRQRTALAYDHVATRVRRDSTVPP